MNADRKNEKNQISQEIWFFNSAFFCVVPRSISIIRNFRTRTEQDDARRVTVQKILSANRSQFAGAEKPGDVHAAQQILNGRNVAVGMIVQARAAPVARK
jgi:hypothetical protein